MGSKGLQVNRSEISRLYGVSLTTVDGWVSRGCPSKKIKTGWEFNTADVWKWLQQEAVKNAA